MKTTNKKLTIEDVFGFTKKREEFNSDTEFMAYLLTEHLEPDFYSSMDKTVNEEELPKERFKMIDVYPDFYTKNCNTATNENTLNMIDVFKLTFSKKREDFILEEEYQNYKIKEIAKVMTQTSIKISPSPVLRRKERERINKLLNK